jgi:predicted nucleic-acid-binding Zn-ribbon protein
MASSTCVKCGSTSFEIKLNTPHGSNFKIYFVQCSSCGGVVGVTDFYNIGAEIRMQNTAIKAIANQVGAHVRLD